MRSINVCLLLAIIVSMILNPFMLPGSNAATGDEQTYYATAIEAIIVNCERKECLKDSRSSHLRRCANTATKKAKFLRNHKEQLVQEMMAEELPLKGYKVERFINARFAEHIKVQH